MAKTHKSLKTFKAAILFLLIAALITIPFTAQAKKEEEKVVRVGWFDSSYNTRDASGRRSGYSYEYQLKLSAYNGWTYEYVEGSWSDLFQMLVDGEIDLMSDISYTEERSELMLYPTLPMGTEEYYIFTAAANNSISITDINTLNGKTIGVNKDSYQQMLLEKWINESKIKTQMVELTTTEEESLEMMENGELDAYATVDSFMDPSRAAPLYKIGSSDYYFAVNKNRPDLLDDLNYAMSKIQDENRYFNQEMFEKYIRKTGANAFLSEEETQWVKDNKIIRIGYQDDYLAFCAKDEKTGELTGVLKDYINLATDCIPNAHLDFDAIAYPTAQAAMEAIKKGEIDCMFPANLLGYESETMGLVTTPSFMSTEMFAIVRSSDPNIFKDEKKIKGAVNEGNPNYEAFLAVAYPNWEKVYFKDTEECLKAVSDSKADCLLISNYRFNNLSRQCNKYHLTSVSVGKNIDYSFAVKKGNTVLYSILAKTTNNISDSAINASLSYYVAEESKLTLVDFVDEYMYVFVIIIAVISLIILALLLQNIKAVKRARRLISATEKDELTGLYTRKYFFLYADSIYAEHPERPMDAFVLNIEQFHLVNELYGRKTGDTILCALGNEIGKIAEENKGIAGRFESDKFDIYCHHIDDYNAVYERLQAKLNEVSVSGNLRLRLGVMPWQEKLEPVVLFDRARTACNMTRGRYNEHFIVYDEKLRERENFDQRLINDLNHGIEAHEFEIYYQPKFDIQSETAAVVGAEALVRWRHSELGLISPDDFIPLFEKKGQIGQLDKYVWSEVARQIEKWKKEYSKVIPVSVNVSRLDIYDKDLVQILEDILSENGLEHDVFRLEITESAYTENSVQVIGVLEELHNKGFKLDMDDFGTGYSSLNMISRMPVDEIKMDRDFIRNVEDNPKNFRIVELVLNIAKSIDAPVIAEGVETESQLKLLKELGCEMVQGYYFSKPVPVDEFEEKFLGK